VCFCAWRGLPQSTGKAVAAGVVLPVAVAAEAMVVPGVGWLAAYLLYKSAAAAQGGQRLNSYLNKPGQVRVSYLPNERMDAYIDLLHSSPNGVLSEEEVEALAADLKQHVLAHPMTMLRERYLRRKVAHRAAHARMGSAASAGGGGSGGSAVQYTALPASVDADEAEERGGSSSTRSTRASVWHVRD